MDASLLLLAGGRDRTAWLPVGNSILLRCVAQSLAPAFSEVLASFVEWVVEQVDATWPEGQNLDQFRTVSTPCEQERLHAALSSQR